MSLLTNLCQEAQTELFKKYFVIFAFSNEQFDKRNKDYTYVDMGAGMYAPKDFAGEVVDGLAEITKNAKNKIKASVAKEKIIWESFANHECGYTGDMNDAVDDLSEYDHISVADIETSFHRYMATQ